MEEEEGSISFTEGEEIEERRPHRGGRVLILEPTNTRELLASPMIVACFKYVGCYDFFEKV